MGTGWGWGETFGCGVGIKSCHRVTLLARFGVPFYRQDVLDEIVKLQNFGNQFLPNALRQFFRETIPPNERNEFLSNLVKKFSERFCDCNPQLNLSQGKQASSQNACSYLPIYQMMCIDKTHKNYICQLEILITTLHLSDVTKYNKSRVYHVTAW